MTTNTQGNSSMGNRKAKFCAYCGERLDEGARFCKNCGEPVIEVTSNQATENQSNPAPRKQTERKTVYEGYIHKCPNCGEIIDSFVSRCPSCGYEIRDTQPAAAVHEFASKIEAIRTQKMPENDDEKSFMKKVLGTDFEDGDKKKEAFARFESQKNKEIASLIINFSVPNTKEDILEFMILASSNIDPDKGLDDEITKAWIAKLDQVYDKARISVKDKSDRKQIQSIYERKQEEIRNAEFAKFVPLILCVVLLIISGYLGALAENPVPTILITLIIIIIVAAVYAFFIKDSDFKRR